MIIEIDGGRYETLERVERSVVSQGVKHLVLWDQDCQNHRLYGVHTWPTAYLIGRDGRVLCEGRPTKAVLSSGGEQGVVDKKTGRRIRDLFSEALRKDPRAGVAQS